MWKSSEDVNADKIKEELADILIYSFIMADKFNFKIDEIIKEKMQKNALKYPVEKSKGIALKYTEL